MPYHSTAATVIASARSVQRSASVSAVNNAINTAQTIHCTNLLLMTNSKITDPTFLSLPVGFHYPNCASRTGGRLNARLGNHRVFSGMGRQVMADDPRRTNLFFVVIFVIIFHL